MNCLFVLHTGECFYSRPGLTVLLTASIVFRFSDVSDFFTRYFKSLPQKEITIRYKSNIRTTLNYINHQR